MNDEVRKRMTDAVTEAARANQRLDGHEALCAERWRQANKMLEGLFRRWWWLMTAIVGGQGTVLIALITLVLTLATGCAARGPLDICPQGVVTRQVAAAAILDGLPARMTTTLMRCARSDRQEM